MPSWHTSLASQYTTSPTSTWCTHAHMAHTDTHRHTHRHMVDDTMQCRCPHPTSRAAGLAYSQWLALAIPGLVVLTRFIRDTVVMDILVHTTWITTCTPHTQTHTHTTQDSIENIHLTTNSVLLSNNLLLSPSQLPPPPQLMSTCGARFICGYAPFLMILILSLRAEVVPIAQQEPQSEANRQHSIICFALSLI